MSPIDAFREMLKVDENTAKVLLTGLALVAAVAIVKAWQIDLNTALLAGLYIAVAGALVYLGSQIISDQTNRLIIGRSLSVLFVIIVCAMSVSALLPGRTPVPPLPCFLKSWEVCSAVLHRLPDTPGADALIAQLAEPPPSPSSDRVSGVNPPSGIVPSKYKVFVQFAGVIRREDVKAFSSRLRESTWNVQGADHGGERTPKAAGINEVRYSAPADEMAARALSQQATAAGLTVQPIGVAQAQGIAPGALEIWLSR